MATNAAEITTAEQLQAANIEGQCELIRGELVMMSPAFGYHGAIANRIAYHLTAHVLANDLGDVFNSETGFLIARKPDTVKAPDVSFVAMKRLKTLDHIERYFPFAPDLAVEVISPSDRYSQVEAKAKQWLEAGTLLVMVADPKRREIQLYRPDGESKRFAIGDRIDLDAAVPGWELAVRDAFPAMYE